MASSVVLRGNGFLSPLFSASFFPVGPGLRGTRQGSLGSRGILADGVFVRLPQ